MERLFRIEDILKYIEEQKRCNASMTRQLSIYYEATQKNLEENEQSLRLWQGYIEVLEQNGYGHTEIRETYKMLKSKYWRYKVFWTNWYEYESRLPVQHSKRAKVLEHANDILQYKECEAKEEILAWLKEKAVHTHTREYSETRTIYPDTPRSRTYMTKPYEHTQAEHTIDVHKGSTQNSTAHSVAQSMAHNIDNSQNNTANNMSEYDIFSQHVYTNARHTGTQQENIENRKKETNTLTGSIFDIVQSKNKTEDREREDSTYKAQSTEKYTESQVQKRITLNGKKLKILRTIGKGGSGTVYQVATDKNEMYALKKIKIRPGAQNEELHKSYVNEVELLKRLKSRHEIVTLKDSYVNRDRIAILMEYGDIDLSRFLEIERARIAGGYRKSPESYNTMLSLWEQMLRAVKCIHEYRIVHRDLKPGNFLFVNGRLKLIDFGISREIRNDTTNIIREKQIGTINYMSPEAIVEGKTKMGLVIGKKGAGQIEYSCEIDLNEIDLDALAEDVVFEEGTVKVYPLRDVEVGVGLNRACKVTLENVFAYSKSTGFRIIGKKSMSPYKEIQEAILKGATEGKNAKILSYDYETGTLEMEVDHF